MLHMEGMEFLTPSFHLQQTTCQQSFAPVQPFLRAETFGVHARPQMRGNDLSPQERLNTLKGKTSIVSSNNQLWAMSPRGADWRSRELKID